MRFALPFLDCDMYAVMSQFVKRYGLHCLRQLPWEHVDAALIVIDENEANAAVLDLRPDAPVVDQGLQCDHGRTWRAIEVHAGPGESFGVGDTLAPPPRPAMQP